MNWNFSQPFKSEKYKASSKDTFNAAASVNHMLNNIKMNQSPYCNGIPYFSFGRKRETWPGCSSTNFPISSSTLNPSMHLVSFSWNIPLNSNPWSSNSCYSTSKVPHKLNPNAEEFIPNQLWKFHTFSTNKTPCHIVPEAKIYSDSKMFSIPCSTSSGCCNSSVKSTNIANSPLCSKMRSDCDNTQCPVGDRPNLDASKDFPPFPQPDSGVPCNHHSNNDAHLQADSSKVKPLLSDLKLKDTELYSSAMEKAKEDSIISTITHECSSKSPSTSKNFSDSAISRNTHLSETSDISDNFSIMSDEIELNDGSQTDENYSYSEQASPGMESISDDDICFKSESDCNDENFFRQGKRSNSNRCSTNENKLPQNNDSLTTLSCDGTKLENPCGALPCFSRNDSNILSFILNPSPSDYSGFEDNDNSDYDYDVFDLDLGEDGVDFGFPIGGALLIPSCSTNNCSDINPSKCVNNNSYNKSTVDISDLCELLIEDIDDDNFKKIDEDLISANKRWNNEIDRNCLKKTPTKISFNDHVEIQSAADWARAGPWEEYARDRMRFRKRIDEAESILEPIFKPEHRKLVLGRLQTDF